MKYLFNLPHLYRDLWVVLVIITVALSVPSGVVASKRRRAGCSLPHRRKLTFTEGECIASIKKFPTCSGSCPSEATFQEHRFLPMLVPKQRCTCCSASKSKLEPWTLLYDCGNFSASYEKEVYLLEALECGCIRCVDLRPY